MRRGDCICEWSRYEEGHVYNYFFLFGTDWVGCIAISHGIAFFFFVIWLSEYRICMCFLFFGLGSFTIVLFSLVLALLVD